jgi:hypothetical protein
MRLENFGEEANVVINSEKNQASPLVILIQTEPHLDYEGTPQVDEVMNQQLEQLNRRANQFIGTTLTKWLQHVNSRKLVTRCNVNEKQCFLPEFVDKTTCNASLVRNLNISVEVFLPEGLITSTAEPVKELQEAMMGLRQKIAKTLRDATEQYAHEVDLRPAEINLELFDVELELPPLDITDDRAVQQ